MKVKILAVLAIVISFAYRVFLSLLERRSVRNPVPANVADVYDRESYRKWKTYHGEKSRIDMIGTLISFIPGLVLVLTNAYAAFAGLFPETDFWQMFAVILLWSALDLLLIPVSWYDTMVIEEKYGFNRTDKKTFWLDTLKEFIINLAVSTVIAAVLMFIYKALGDWMIIVFAAVMMLFVLAISFLYPFLSRIFNKFTPLEEGELKERLTGLLEKHGYTVRAIQVMDASRRSTKSNAYFTGFGKMKTIVLYDTLVQSMTPDEICAVFAHEMGHGLHRDTLKNQLLSAVQMLILAVFAWLTLRTPEIFTPFGFEGVNYGFALFLILSAEFTLLSPLLSLATGFHSRRAEYRADAQAVQEGYADALISGLKKLARENFADLSPDPLLVKLTYSHPTLSQRIEAIRKA